MLSQPKDLIQKLRIYRKLLY